MLDKALKESLTFAGRAKPITEQVKKHGLTIYGAQSVKAQIGFLARETSDYDIYARQPKKEAHFIEHKLDRMAGSNVYYMKPAMHKGTYKVKYVGADRIKNTRDDIEIADYTKPSRKIKTVNVRGINYVALIETEKDKLRALKDKQYAFRHAKDREDVVRIKTAREFGSLWRR